MAACGAVFATEEDNLKVEGIPCAGWIEGFEIGFGLLDIFAAAETPTSGEAVDVGIDGKGGMSEALRHDDGSGLVTDAGEFFEGVDIFGNLAVVFVEEDLR